MTKEMFEEITAWQKKIFTKATPLSAANHLEEETLELCEAIMDSDINGDDDTRRKAVMEYADCFLLLFGSACLYGLSYEDICKAINDKMGINKSRKWGEPNEHGYVKHID